MDHGGNLEECVNALRALLDIEVSGYASAGSRCEDGSCSAEAEVGGEASVGCAVAPSGPAGGKGLPVALLAGLGALAWARRKRVA